jgi:integrase
MILTEFGTGLRLSELRGLAWEDVGLNAKLLRVRRSPDRHNVITETLITES